jgi:TDG/mug DNA glycosylase family protein
MAVRPTPADLAAAEGRFVPDVLRPGLRVLFCGINPGLWSAAVGHHFARPGNRFWKALHLGGLTPRQLAPDEEDELLALGLGITNLVERATAGAADLGPGELRAGGRSLAAKAAAARPRLVAVLGVGAYRTAFARPKVSVGPLPDPIGGSAAWLLPNPAASTPTTSSPTWPRRSPGCAGRWADRRGQDLGRGGSRRPCMPPSTASTVPVVAPASGLAR